MKTLRMLTMALLVAGMGMGQAIPQTTVVPLYFNRAACAPLVPLLGACRQYVMVILESQDASVTAFRVTISYTNSSEKVLSQSTFTPVDAGVGYAIFYHVDDITLKGVSVVPLQEAGPTVSIP